MRNEIVMTSSVTVTQARAQLPRLIRQKKTVAIRRHGNTEAFLVPRERMEAILETMELLANPEAMTAIRRDRLKTVR
jgi:antitoxin YefM